MSDQILPPDLADNNAANNNMPIDCCMLQNNNEITKLASDDDIGIANKQDEVKHGVDCPICLQKCVYPVQLPCTHIFCFLCAKGNAQRSNRCALCRQDIPQDFFLKPKLIDTEEIIHTLAFDNGFQWYYEGRNGWWQYDTRASKELEKKYKRGDKKFEMLIAGWLYIIDLENMVQFRKNSEGRKRKVKRDLINIPEKKGVAGLKIQSDTRSGRPDSDGEAAAAPPPAAASNLNDTTSVDGSSQNHADSPPPPNNTPQTLHTPDASPPPTTNSSHQDLSTRLANLNLGGSEALDSSSSHDNEVRVPREDTEATGATRSTYI